MTTEAEGIDQHCPDRLLTRHIGHIVKVALRVRVLQVNRWGMTPFRIVSTAATAEMAPAPPMVCPSMDLLALIGTLWAHSPNKDLIALVSVASLSLVLVP